MASLIEDLQLDALNARISVTELLQRCLVVAAKLAIPELQQWARLELDGYAHGDVPKYREVSGSVQAYNPYHGYQPVHFESPEHAELASHMHFNQPISEIEYHVQQCDRSNSSSISVSYQPAVENMLMRAIGMRASPSLCISVSQLQRILEAVRRAVLEWALRLEAAGVRGEGMSFSSSEKATAKGVAQQINNYVFGDLSNSQIQLGTSNSEQQMASPFDMAELASFIAKLKQSIHLAGVEGRDRRELEADLQTLEAQIQSPTPKSSIVKEALHSIRAILEGVAGNIVAAGLVSELQKLFL